MYHLKPDEFNALLSQHQPYVNSLGHKGTKIQINKFDLSKYEIRDVSLTDSLITESIFCDNSFEHVEIFDAVLCGCQFHNVNFFDVNFVKTDLSFCVFDNCQFINTKLKRCETYETIFENSQFISCALYDVFSYSLLQNIIFCDMDLRYLDFYHVIIDNIKLKNVRGFVVDKAVLSLNTGNFKNKNIITGASAIEYFQKGCTYE